MPSPTRTTSAKIENNVEVKSVLTPHLKSTVAPKRNGSRRAIDEYLSSDSDDESLGSLDNLERNKVFHFQLSLDGAGVPTIKISPSDLRHKGNLSASNEGDHVNAYVLLLQAIACCQGENIKHLPEIFYNVITTILPEKTAFFKKEKELLEDKLYEMRIKRKMATADLRNAGSFITEVTKKNLRYAEFEAIARHIEEIGNEFVKKANQQENAAFEKTRSTSKKQGEKQATKGININIQVKRAGHESHSLAKLNYFNQNLGHFIGEFGEEVNYKESYTWQNTAGTALYYIFHGDKKTSKAKAILDEYANDLAKLGQTFSLFCRDVKNNPSNLNSRKPILARVAETASDLYDYIATGVSEGDDNWVTFVTTLSKHISLIFSAFPNLQRLPDADKQEIRIEIIDNVCSRQGWYELARLEDEDNALTKIQVDEMLIKIEKEQKNAVRAKEQEFETKHQPIRNAARQKIDESLEKMITFKTKITELIDSELKDRNVIVIEEAIQEQIMARW